MTAVRRVASRAGRAAAVLTAVPFVVGFATAAADPPHRELCRFSDPAIVEASGLVQVGGLLVTTNDSGDTGRVFVVDPATCDTVGVTRWSPDPTDVEALAPGGPGHRGEVWVGDLGDNGSGRTTVTVLRVPVGRVDQTVEPESYELAYPGGPVDAETLMTDPRTGRLVVVTKGVLGGRVLLAPRTLDPDRPNRMRLVGSAVGIATDGAFWPDGRHLVVRDYGRAVVYTWPGLDEVGVFRLPDERQGESIAVTGDDTVVVTSEGARAPVLQVPLPARLARAVAPPEPDPTEPGASASASPGPSGAATPPDDRAGQQDPEQDPQEPPLWPWLVGGAVGAGVLVVLLRALRPR